MVLDVEDEHQQRLQQHWHYVYEERGPNQVSWHQDSPESSLTLLEHAALSPFDAIIDVGGGASRFVDRLLEAGYANVTVVDLAETALDFARARLGERADDVRWVVGDVLSAELGGPFDLWHDRAVFHFLTEQSQRRRYFERLRAELRATGQVILATFALDGPKRCSGLPVVRYSAQTLSEEVGYEFSLVETWEEDHLTPAGHPQRFVFCRFRRREVP